MPITTDVSSNLDQGEVYNIMWFKFVNDLRQVSGLSPSPVLLFPPPIKLTVTVIYWNIVESGVKDHKTKSNHKKIIWKYSSIFITTQVKEIFEYVEDQDSN